VALAPTEEDKSDLTHPGQDSLRWEGALEDPIAEAQRLEVYRANRRKRYMASITLTQTQTPQNEIHKTTLEF